MTIQTPITSLPILESVYVRSCVEFNLDPDSNIPTGCTGRLQALKFQDSFQSSGRDIQVVHKSWRQPDAGDRGISLTAVGSTQTLP
jgi:hypothetical protein